MAEALAGLRQPLPPLRPGQDLYLRSEMLPALSEDRRRELWWWVRQRGLRVYPGEVPEPSEMDAGAAFQVVDFIRGRSTLYQQADWLLCWYLCAGVVDLDDRERKLLGTPQGHALALVGLTPLPAWFADTRLGRALGEFGWR